MAKRKKNNELQDKVNKLEKQLVINHTMLSRQSLSQWISKTHDDNRNLYDIFGYPEEINNKQYLAKYKRQDIANRIMRAYPEACWTKGIKVTDDENAEEESKFENEFDSVSKKLKIIHNVKRADIVSGFGKFGVLFIGVRDGIDSRLPIEKDKLTVDDILFLTPYSEINTNIQTFDNDPQSPRFGLPETYQLYTQNFTDKESKKSSITAHWTRVIHIAEGALENELYGTPRLEPIYNRLNDLEKVVGGSSEMFWLNGRGGLNLNAPTGSEIVNKESLSEEMENFTHGLTRYIRTKGMDLNTLNFNVPNPEANSDVILKLISGATGIPARILTGSERGELASSQDENNWNKRVQERREDFCENQILRPLIDWFIEYGVLSMPKDEDYTIIWPTIKNVSEKDQAEIASKIAGAISAYTASRGELLVPESQFVELLGLEYKEDAIPEGKDLDNLDDIEEG